MRRLIYSFGVRRKVEVAGIFNRASPELRHQRTCFVVAVVVVIFIYLFFYLFIYLFIFHMRTTQTQIRVFVIRFQYRIIPIDVILKSSRL